MNDVHLILLGFALGSIPTVRLSRVLLAWLTKRLGVKPKRIEATQEATESDS